MEPDTSQILRAMEGWRRRLSLRRGLVQAHKVMAVGAALVGAFLLIGLFVPIPAGALQSPAVIGAIGLAVTALAALIALWTTRFSRRDAAQVVDLRQDAGALYTTAEDVLTRLERGESVSEAQRRCLERASAEALALPLAELVPLRPSPWWAASLVVILLGVALPLAPFAVDQAVILDQQRLEAASEAVKELNKRLDKLDEVAQLDPSMRRELRRLARRIQAKEIKPREALEEIGDLKRRMRSEQLKNRESASRANRAARAAARELGRGESTSKLAQRLAEGARTEQSRSERERSAAEAADAARRLKQLSRPGDRAEARERLGAASRAAEAAGDARLSEALQQASGAVASGDNQSMDRAAEDLREALRQAGDAAGQEHLNELAEALDQVQRQLAGQQAGRGTASGDERQVAPGPRDWSRGGAPGEGPPGEGEPGSMAGKGHSDAEQEGKESGDKHFDADRSSDDVPEEALADYKELYEKLLLEDPNRIITAVKGEKGEGVEQDQVDVLRGGRQAPRDEQARGVIERLPVTYADDARESMDNETVPPGYREAVRHYFDERQ